MLLPLLNDDEMQMLVKEKEYLYDGRGLVYEVAKGLYDRYHREREGFLLVGKREYKPDGSVSVEVIGFDETSSIPNCERYTPRSNIYEENKAVKDLEKTGMDKYLRIKLHTHTYPGDLDKKSARFLYSNDRPSLDDITNILIEGRANLRDGREYFVATLHTPTGKCWALKLNTRRFTPDFHNSNRVPTTYDRIYANITRISQRHPRVTVESVVTSENFSNPERSRFADDLTKGCDIFGIRFSFLMNKGRAKGFYDSLKVPAVKIDEAKELCKTYSKTYEINFSAYDGRKPFDPRLHLDPFGKITFFGKPLGNALEETSDSIFDKAISMLEELYSVKARIIEI